MTAHKIDLLLAVQMPVQNLEPHFMLIGSNQRGRLPGTDMTYILTYFNWHNFEPVILE